MNIASNILQCNEPDSFRLDNWYDQYNQAQGAGEVKHCSCGPVMLGSGEKRSVKTIWQTVYNICFHNERPRVTYSHITPHSTVIDCVQ